MIDASRLLSRFAYGLWYADLPKEVVEATKMALADYLAACFAGYREFGKIRIVLKRLLYVAVKVTYTIKIEHDLDALDEVAQNTIDI